MSPPTGFDYCSTGGVSKIFLVGTFAPPKAELGESWLLSLKQNSSPTMAIVIIIVCGPCLTELIDRFFVGIDLSKACATVDG